MTSSRPKDCVYFITPVFERYALTEICLKQKVDACVKLEAAGISANCVVIGDDDNLRIAADLGFATVERDNQYLGRKFNDGHEYAVKHGATHVAPVGSDSWMDPTYMFGSLPHTRAILVSRHYAMVHKTGMKRAYFHIPYVSYVVPVELMRPCNFRPILDTRPKGCDTNTMASLELDGKGPVRHLSSKTSHKLDTVAFQSVTQITDYNRLYGRWGIDETYDPFHDLRDVYPGELVDMVERYYDVSNDETSYQLLEAAIPYVKRVGGGTGADLLFRIECCLVKYERANKGTNEGTNDPPP